MANLRSWGKSLSDEPLSRYNWFAPSAPCVSTNPPNLPTDPIEMQQHCISISSRSSMIRATTDNFGWGSRSFILPLHGRHVPAHATNAVALSFARAPKAIVLRALMPTRQRPRPANSPHKMESTGSESTFNHSTHDSASVKSDEIRSHKPQRLATRHTWCRLFSANARWTSFPIR